MFDKDDKIIEFKTKYPHTLPQDWKDEANPTIYEINATLETLKKIYAEQVIDIESGVTPEHQGAENLRNIATNYQSIKSILFQPR